MNTLFRSIPTAFILGVFAFFSVQLGDYYFQKVSLPFADMPGAQGRLQLHEGILAGTEVAPYRYRPLYPYLTEGVARWVSRTQGLQGLDALKVAWDLTDKALFFLMFCCLYLYCRRFYPRYLAFLGVLVVIATMKVTMKDHGYAPWYFIEPSLMALTLYFGLDRRIGAILILTIIGRLNRDTGAFLPIYYLIVSWPYYRVHREKWKEPALLIAVGFLMDILVRTYQGWGAPYCHPLSWGFFWQRLNYPGHLRDAWANWVDFLGVYWVFFFIGCKTSEGYIKRSILPLIINALGHLRIGAWTEVIMLNPMYAVFLTVGLDPVYRLEKRVTPALRRLFKKPTPQTST